MTLTLAHDESSFVRSQTLCGAAYPFPLVLLGWENRKFVSAAEAKLRELVAAADKSSETFVALSSDQRRILAGLVPYYHFQLDLRAGDEQTRALTVTEGGGRGNDVDQEDG